MRMTAHRTAAPQFGFQNEAVGRRVAFPRMEPAFDFAVAFTPQPQVDLSGLEALIVVDEYDRRPERDRRCRGKRI
jgi:hypothetical protein